MRTVIPGSGSLGIIIGSLIAKNRRQVDRVDSYKENVDALNAKGATVLLCPRRSFDRQKVRLLRLVAPHALQPRVVAGHDHGDGSDERPRRHAEQGQVGFAGHVLHDPIHARPEPTAEIANGVDHG